MIGGAEDGPLVLLLHGFAETFHMWRSQMPALAATGYRAVAPSQRGYSAGARPDTREPSCYSFDELVKDAVSIATACGNASGRFMLSATIGAEASPGVSRTVIRIASLL